MNGIPWYYRWRPTNWLIAKPWRWHYRAIWQDIEGDPPLWRRLWWTITFPHVHHESEE